MSEQPLVSVLWQGDGSETGFADLQAQTLTQLQLIRSTDEVRPTGRYVLYAAPPCHFDRAMLETMVAQMERTGAHICICGRQIADTKQTVMTGVAQRVDQKLALVTRLIERNLFLTPNNTLLRRSDGYGLEDTFVQGTSDAPMVMLSNAFVSLPAEPARPDAHWGIALLRALLEQGRDTQ